MMAHEWGGKSDWVGEKGELRVLKWLDEKLAISWALWSACP